MTTIYFVLITHLDSENKQTTHFSKFRDPAEAEDIMHSMQKGVFNDDYVNYQVDKIVYELEEEGW